MVSDETQTAFFQSDAINRINKLTLWKWMGSPKTKFQPV